LFVKQFSFVSPSLIGFGLSTEVLIWVAVGGRQVLMAAFLGALIVRWVEGLLSERLGNFWLLALGLLFAATVVLMPYGLFGRILALPLPRRLRRIGTGAPRANAFVAGKEAERKLIRPADENPPRPASADAD
jgi:urea transport system permease protein